MSEGAIDRSRMEGGREGGSAWRVFRKRDCNNNALTDADGLAEGGREKEAGEWQTRPAARRYSRDAGSVTGFGESLIPTGCVISPLSERRVHASLESNFLPNPVYMANEKSGFESILQGKVNFHFVLKVEACN